MPSRQSTRPPRSRRTLRDLEEELHEQIAHVASNVEHLKHEFPQIVQDQHKQIAEVASKVENIEDEIPGNIRDQIDQYIKSLYQKFKIIRTMLVISGSAIVMVFFIFSGVLTWIFFDEDWRGQIVEKLNNWDVRIVKHLEKVVAVSFSAQFTLTNEPGKTQHEILFYSTKSEKTELICQLIFEGKDRPTRVAFILNDTEKFYDYTPTQEPVAKVRRRIPVEKFFEDGGRTQMGSGVHSLLVRADGMNMRVTNPATTGTTDVSLNQDNRGSNIKGKCLLAVVGRGDASILATQD